MPWKYGFIWSLHFRVLKFEFRGDCQHAKIGGGFCQHFWSYDFDDMGFKAWFRRFTWAFWEMRVANRIGTGSDLDREHVASQMALYTYAKLHASDPVPIHPPRLPINARSTTDRMRDAARAPENRRMFRGFSPLVSDIVSHKILVSTSTVGPSRPKINMPLSKSGSVLYWYVSSCFNFVPFFCVTARWNQAGSFPDPAVTAAEADVSAAALISVAYGNHFKAGNVRSVCCFLGKKLPGHRFLGNSCWKF